MKRLKAIRYSEWWEYKLVPLLAIGYATLLNKDYSLYPGARRLLFLLLSITIGAIYVSVINDITDIAEDKAAGKANRMATVSRTWRIILPLLCVSAGGFFAYQMYPDTLSIFLYTMAWVVFSLYSLPPVRLKKRGIGGPLCDAMGAHFFPSLLVVSSLSYFAGRAIDDTWFWAVAVWSFCYGLRGILWHQFYDRENDIKAGVKTYASSISPSSFRGRELLIMIIELIAFAWMLSHFLHIAIFIALVLYLALLIIRARRGYKTVMIITPQNKPYQVLMADFYYVFFPLALLFTAAFTQRYAWIVLLAHILLFPKKIKLVVKDFLGE